MAINTLGECLYWPVWWKRMGWHGGNTNLWRSHSLWLTCTRAQPVPVAVTRMVALLVTSNRWRWSTKMLSSVTLKSVANFPLPIVSLTFVGWSEKARAANSDRAFSPSTVSWQATNGRHYISWQNHMTGTEGIASHDKIVWQEQKALHLMTKSYDRNRRHYIS